MYLCTIRTSERDTQRPVLFYFMGERKRIPANVLVSHLEFHRPPFGCSLCNLSRHLQENHSRIISPHREGTTEAANLQIEARAWSQLLPTWELPPRTQQWDLTKEAGSQLLQGA